MFQINSNYIEIKLNKFSKGKEQIFEKRKKITQFAMEKLCQL